jgi:hypothetical protein
MQNNPRNPSLHGPGSGLGLGSGRLILPLGCLIGLLIMLWPVQAHAYTPEEAHSLLARAGVATFDRPETIGVTGGLAARARHLQVLATYLAGDDAFAAIIRLATAGHLPDATLGHALREDHDACGPTRFHRELVFLPGRVGRMHPFFLYDPRTAEYVLGGVLPAGSDLEVLVHRTDGSSACMREDGRIVFLPTEVLVLGSPVPCAFPADKELLETEPLNTEPYRYRRFMVANGLIHLVEADLARVPFSVVVSPFYDALRPGPERALFVDELARRGGARVAINGTFFNMQPSHQLYGLPVGSFLAGGEVVHSLESPSLNALNRCYAAFTDRGRLVIGETTVPGGEIRRANLAGTFDPARLGTDRIVSFGGGFGWLVKDRDPEGWKPYAGKQFDPSFYSRTSRRARSLLGVDAAGRRVFFLAQEEGSASPAPLSLPELAEYLVAKTAYRDVVFLDGGGSTQLVVEGRTVSNPANGGAYRKNSSALLLMPRHGPGEADRLGQKNLLVLPE